MADGTVIVTKVTGTGTLYAPTTFADGLIYLSRVAAQGRLGAGLTAGNATGVLTSVVATAYVYNVRGTPIWTTPIFIGNTSVGSVNSVTAQGFNFKNYLYPYVYNQIPENIRNANPLFVKFLEGYYRFLDTANNPNDILLNSQNWTDVDATLDIFVDRLRTQFAWDFPNTAIMNARRFVKLVHEFYESKGTEESMELFFRMLYDQEITVQYPGQLVLRASDGRWKRDVSLKLDTTGYSGHKLYVYFGEDYNVGEETSAGYVIQIGNNSDPFNLIGRIVTISFWETVPGIGLINTRKKVNVLDVKQTLNPLIYDLIVDLDITTRILDQTTVEFEGLTYGTLTRQLSTYRIITPGTNFAPSDILYVNELGGTGEYFQNDAGNYSNTWHAALEYVSSNPVNGGIARVTTTDVSSGVKTITIINEGFLYHSGVFQITLSSATSVTPTTIEFTTSFIYQHRGIFLDSSGLLSDACVMQDNFLYQPYSYIVQSKIDPIIWKDSFLQVVHPAGVKMFGQYVIEDDFNFRMYVSATDDTRNTLKSFVNTFFTTDGKSWNLTKVLPGDTSHISDTIWSYVLNKNVTDSVVQADIVSKMVGKNISDPVTSSDLFDRVVIYNRSFTDTQITSETFIKNVSKILLDAPTTLDVLAKNIQKPFADTQITSDSPAKSVNKPATDVSTTSDFVTRTIGKRASDTTVSSDALIKNVSKLLNDAGTTSDIAKKSISKAFTDSVASSDFFMVSAFVHPFANETPHTSDAINSFVIGKGVTDVGTTSDNIVKNINRPMLDISVTSDVLMKNINRPIQDAVTSSDVIFKVVSYLRPVTDAVVTLDVFSRTVMWYRTFAEYVATSDVFSYAVTYNRTFTESVIQSDFSVINTGKAITETVHPADTGVGYVEDYSDPTYFNPGYIGITFSF